MGKYFADGDAYKEAMKEIAKKFSNEGDLIDITFLWFDDNVMEELNHTAEDVCAIINDMCYKADQLSQEVKGYCVMYYHIHIKPMFDEDGGDDFDIHDDSVMDCEFGAIC
jgi:hypothetical protein